MGKGMMQRILDEQAHVASMTIDELADYGSVDDVVVAMLSLFGTLQGAQQLGEAPDGLVTEGGPYGGRQLILTPHLRGPGTPHVRGAKS